MERSVDSQLEVLRRLILTMGGSVERSLECAIDGLSRRSADYFNEVHKFEEKINEDHVKVDNECMSFLAIQGPVAKDLRFIISLIKINSDLERMGDQCVNISYSGKDFLSRPKINVPIEITEMASLVRKMVRESLDSFIREDTDSAKKILMVDDEVDQRKQKVFRDLVDFIQKNPTQVESALDLILIARNLERLGDHATNIAEVVIFFSTGKDVRHGGKYS